MMRLLGNILAVDPLPLLSDLSLAVRRPKRSKGAARPQLYQLVCGFFAVERDDGESYSDVILRLAKG